MEVIMKKEYEQKIKCNVHECSYNNIECDLCRLEAIKVSCCYCNDSQCKEETMCASFKKRK